MSEEELKQMSGDELIGIIKAQRFEIKEKDFLIQELRDTIDNQREEIDRLNNNLKELSDFAIKIYKKELDKTSDWWLQEELKTSFDDINLSTNFRLEEALKENNK